MKQLKLLLGLRFRLTYKHISRSKMALLNLVASVLILLPLSGVSAFGLWFILSETPIATHTQIVRIALTLIFAFWAFAPLLGIQINEAYDITKLFVYPVSTRTIFAGVLIGCLTDTTVIMMLPTLFVAALHDPSTWPVTVVQFLFLLLFTLFTLGVSQALMLAQFGFLKSRKFRDIATVLIPMMGMGYVIAQQSFVRQIGDNMGKNLVGLPIWRIADFLPSGWTASGLQAVRDGNLALISGFALLLIAGTTASYFVAAHSIKALYFGDTGPAVSAAQAPAVAAPTTSSQELAPGLTRRLSPVTQAVIRKELFYLQRDPAFKVLLLRGVYLVAVILIPIFASGDEFTSHRVFGNVTKLYAAVGAVLFSILPVPFNSIGSEGAAVTVLLSSPASRRDILLGKNLVHGVMLGAASLVVIGGVGYFADIYLPLCYSALAIMLMSVPVLLAVGNATSVLLPYAGLPRGQRFARPGTTSQTSFLFLLQGLLAIFCAALLVIPIAGAVVLPQLLDHLIWLLLTVPAAIAYSGTVYQIMLNQAAEWLRTREPETMKRIVPKEG